MEILTCKNCGKEFTDNYCNHCGQKKIGRHHFNEIRDYLGDAFELKRGFPKTLIGLLTKPSIVIRDYLNGKTKPYQNPISLALTIAAITYIFSSIIKKYIEKDESETSETIIYISLLSFVLVFALLFKWFFSKAGLNYFERLIISTYLTTLLLIYVQIIDLMDALLFEAGGTDVISVILFVVIIMLLTAQFCVPLFKDQKRVWIRTILLAIVAPLITFTIIGLIIMLQDILEVQIF